MHRSAQALVVNRCAEEFLPPSVCVCVCVLLCALCVAGVYLLRHWQLNQQDKYWRMLRQLVLQAQQLNDETLLDNPYLTVVHMLSVEGQG